MNTAQNRKAIRYALPSVYFLFSVVYFFFVDGILPSVMQDELVYKLGATGITEDADFPNYFYYFVFSVANFFGDDFYLAAKALNLIFHTFTSTAIYIFFLQFKGERVAFLSGMIFQLSPFLAFTSFFMPEALYGFLVITGILLFWKLWAADVWQTWPLLIPGAVFGLAQLTKPHGAFVFGMVLVWTVVAGRSSARAKLRFILVLLAGFILSRFALGYLFAGSQAFDVFGDYLSEEAGGIEAVTTALSDILLFTQTFAINSLQHFGFLLLVTIPVLVLVITSQKRPPQFFVFLLFLVCSVSVFIAAFEAYISIGGDDHLLRLLARHYEFLIPLLFASPLVSLNEAINRRDSLLASVFIFLASVVFLTISLLEGYLWNSSGYSDSGFTTGLRTPEGTWLFALVGLLFLVYLARKAILATSYLMFSALLMLVPSALTSIENYGDNSTPLPSDLAGYYVRDAYEDLPGDRILVIGGDKALTEASIFLMDKNADFEVLSPGSQVRADSSTLEYDIIVQHTEVALVGLEEFTIFEEGFAITDLRSLPESVITELSDR